MKKTTIGILLIVFAIILSLYAGVMYLQAINYNSTLIFMTFWAILYLPITLTILLFKVAWGVINEN